jgi:DNA-binding NtrC family response regulator
MPHVIVIDDDPILLQALTETVRLGIDGVIVDMFDSPRAALEWINHHDYDVIVSDIKMPEMDGLTLLDNIQALRPGVPTILITGHHECDLAVRALRNGAYDFIQKPIDRRYFLKALNAAIQVRHLIREAAESQPEEETTESSPESTASWSTSCRNPRVTCMRRPREAS